MIPRLTFLLCTAALLTGCMAHAPRRPMDVLDAYSRYGNTRRVIDPQGYVEFLRKERFPNGELEGLPRCAVILHDARVAEFLERMGYAPGDWVVRAIGQTDPNVLHVVKARAGRPAFILNGGMPGAGAVSTQAAELSALGVRSVVHIGTAGLLGDGVPSESLVLGTASYKDGGAVLLSPPGSGPVARADTALERMLAEALTAGGTPFVRGTGFTMPVFYFQPSGMILWLLRGPELAAERPGFVEMEEAPFFEMARLTGMRAASLVAGTDRYRVQSDTLTHEFMEYDSDALKARALDAALRAFATAGCGG